MTYPANFIPEIWSKKLQKIFDPNSVFMDVVNRDYEGEIKKAGDTVNVRTFGDITINDYTKEQTISFEALTDPMDTITIAQQKYFAFKVDDIDKAQQDINVLEGYTKRAAIAIRNKKDQHIHAIGYANVDASNITGTSGSPITLSTSNIYGYIVDMGKQMDDQNCPMDGRHLVVNPSTKALLLKSDEFTRATSLGDDVIQNGKIGSVGGFTVHCSTNLNASGGNTPLLALTKDFITYADQVVDVENVRPYDMFANAVKGLYVYQAHVLSNHDGCGAVLWASGT